MTDLLLWSRLKFEGASIERFSNWTLAYVAGIRRGVWNSGVWECEGIGKGRLGRTTNCKLQLHSSCYFFIVATILLLWSIKVRNCFWLNRPCNLKVINSVNYTVLLHSFLRRCFCGSPCNDPPRLAVVSPEDVSPGLKFGFYMCKHCHFTLIVFFQA